jgi:hypothetical protein
MNKNSKRFKLVEEIFIHCEKINSDRQALLFLIAIMTDEELENFHKTFLQLAPKN